MKSRPCPVCTQTEAQVVMRFTPNLISQMNVTYRADIFRDIFEGREERLVYVRCSHCGMIYCPTFWSNETFKKVYEDSIHHGESREKTQSLDKRIWLVREWEQILRIFAIEGVTILKDLKLVDFGCGWGDFLDVVSGYGVSCVGFEQDSLKLKSAEGRGHKVVKTIEELKTFVPADVVVMNTVFEHLQEVESVMSLLKEWLRPGGLFVFSTMDFRPAFIQKNKKRLDQGLPALTKDLNPVEHVNIYDYHSIAATLHRHRFQWIGTGTVLDWANLPLPLIRNSRTFIRLLNILERVSSAFIQGDPLSIIVYARNT